MKQSHLHGIRWATGLTLVLMMAACSEDSKPTGTSADLVRRVPAEYPTIQSAIVAAAEGDTVLVSPGTYTEAIDFLGKAIVVTSTNGPKVAPTLWAPVGKYLPSSMMIRASTPVSSEGSSTKFTPPKPPPLSTGSFFQVTRKRLREWRS